jgi:hypothetical protein
MISFVISPLVFFPFGMTFISNVSHIITMTTLIRGHIFSFSLTLMIFSGISLESEIPYESGSPFENETFSFHPWNEKLGIDLHLLIGRLLSWPLLLLIEHILPINYQKLKLRLLGDALG